MIKIEVGQGHRQVNWTDDKGQRQSFPVQTAYAHLPGEPYPVKIEISPPKGQSIYPSGLYVLAAEAFYVNKNGKLAVDAGRLQRLPSEARKAG